MKTWPEVNFGQLYAAPSKNGIYKSAEHHGSGCRMVNMGELFAFDFLANQDMKLVQLTDDELDRNGLQDGDLLFGRRSLVEAGAGKCSLVVAPTEPLTFESSIIRVRLDPQKANARFYFYYFASPQGRGVVRSIVTGTNVKGIRGTLLARIRVANPEVEEQERIAEVLRPYDDLIENNTRRMALLEQSARLLYEEWFVRLRFPGREHTRIIDGVPEGWKRQPLEDISEFRLGKMLDQKKNKGDLMPYLANVNVRWGSFDLCDLRKMRFEDDEFEAFGLKCGDIVMCEGGEPGRCAVWKEQMPRMMIQKALHRIRCQTTIPHEFLYYTLRHLGQTGYLATLFTGATIKHLPREKLAMVTVVVPPRTLLDLFINYVRPIEDQLKVLEAANGRAIAARDLLLPRLMSGEVAV